MNKNRGTIVLNLDSHLTKAGDGGQTVCPLKEMVDLRGSSGNRAEHDGPVGDGFVSRNGDLAFEAAAWIKFHKVSSWFRVTPFRICWAQVWEGFLNMG